jgi:epoxyqueuosine reductase
LKSQKEYDRLIREKALELGFSDCGFSPAVVGEEDIHVLENWLEKGMHAGMEWMSKSREIRKDPRKLVPNAQTVVSVLLNYYTSRLQEDPEAPVVSKYAYGRDYHKVVKNKLKALLAYIKELIPEANGRAFVDSAPVMEHFFARNAGLGWIGKNSLLISPKFGSYVFLGELILDVKLETDRQTVKDLCGNCRLCIDECPTHAIQPGKKVDAGKCISYLTIEHKGKIPDIFKNSFFNRVFGCDICQEVCPWNRKLMEHDTPDFIPSSALTALTSKKWKNLDKQQFELIFTGTPVVRTGYEGLRRNIDFIS